MVVQEVLSGNLACAGYVLEFWHYRGRYLASKRQAGKEEEFEAMIDPIADFITRIRNASMVFKEQVDTQYSKVNEAVASILKNEGFIKDYTTLQEEFKNAKKSENKRKILRVFLKYTPDNERLINDIQRLSKPGKRVYVSKDEIPLIKAGLGIAILSTNKGILAGHEARKAAVGGEVLCYVW